MRAIMVGALKGKGRAIARARIFSALALFAFVLQALIPSGWMPARDASGLASLVICTPNGAQTLTVDAQGHKQAPHPKQGRADHICAFAGANASALAGANAPALPVPVGVAAPKLFALAALPAGPWRLTLYSSRAPPALL